MVSDRQIAVFFIILISTWAIVIYMIIKGLMTAELALGIFFSMLSFAIMWFWGIDEIRFRRAIRR
jgi:hypothetical protein